jgi:NOL1/NOP2/sun family putative RNA methylase
MHLPDLLIQSLQGINGFNEEAFKAVHQLAEPLTSIRINPEKCNIQHLTFNIEEPVPWSSNGYYLSERPSFTLDPLFHAGAYYVQEASSMFLEQALKQTVDLSQPLKVLDLCAAPGGKSTLLQSLISKESVLISNEVIKTRVNVLSENITKWGAANVMVTNNDAKDFKRLQNYFDVIIVDAPCSGSGLFRKDTAAINEWSVNNVQLCGQRQQRILVDIISSLKENGVLIYSTCSYSKEEDEDICDWMIKELKIESVKLKLNSNRGIVETISEKENSFGYRFYPDKIKGEGFFIAVFKKQKNEVIGKQQKVSKKNLEFATAKEINVCQAFLKKAADFFFIKQGEEIIAIPVHLQNDLISIQSSLYIKKAGIKTGTVIRNELIPDHELALSTILNASIPSVAVDLEMALQYLRRKEIKITTAFKGWALITYNSLPLGWAKILPNRINNYYPVNWRIVNK